MLSENSDVFSGPSQLAAPWVSVEGTEQSPITPSRPGHVQRPGQNGSLMPNVIRWAERNQGKNKAQLKCHCEKETASHPPMMPKNYDHGPEGVAVAKKTAPEGIKRGENTPGQEEDRGNRKVGYNLRKGPGQTMDLRVELIQNEVRAGCRPAQEESLPILGEVTRKKFCQPGYLATRRGRPVRNKIAGDYLVRRKNAASECKSERGLVSLGDEFPRAVVVGGPIRPKNENELQGKNSCGQTRKFIIKPNVGRRRTRKSVHEVVLPPPTKTSCTNKIYAIPTFMENDNRLRKPDSNMDTVDVDGSRGPREEGGERTAGVSGSPNETLLTNIKETGDTNPPVDEKANNDQNNNNVNDAVIPGVSADVEEIGDLIRFSTEEAGTGEETPSVGSVYGGEKNDGTGRDTNALPESFGSVTPGEDEVFDWSEHVEEEERIREMEERAASEAENAQAEWLKKREGEILDQIQWACRTSGRNEAATDQLRDKCVNIGYSVHEFYICLENATADGHLDVGNEGKTIHLPGGEDDIGKKKTAEERRGEVRRMWDAATSGDRETGKRKAGRPPGAKNKKYTKERSSNRSRDSREKEELQRPLPLSFHQRNIKKTSIETSDDTSGGPGRGSSGSEDVWPRKVSSTGITPLVPALRMSSRRRPRDMTTGDPALEWRRVTSSEQVGAMGPPSIHSNNTLVIMEQTPGRGYDGGDDNSDATERAGVRREGRRSRRDDWQIDRTAKRNNNKSGCDGMERSRSRIKTEPGTSGTRMAGRPIPVISLSDEECLRGDDNEEIEELQSESMEAEEISVIGPLPPTGQPSTLPKNKQSSPKPQTAKGGHHRQKHNRSSSTPRRTSWGPFSDGEDDKDNFQEEEKRHRRACFAQRQRRDREKKMKEARVGNTITDKDEPPATKDKKAESSGAPTPVTGAAATGLSLIHI